MTKTQSQFRNNKQFFCRIITEETFLCAAYHSFYSVEGYRFSPTGNMTKALDLLATQCNQKQTLGVAPNGWWRGGGFLVMVNTGIEYATTELVANNATKRLFVFATDVN